MYLYPTERWSLYFTGEDHRYDGDLERLDQDLAERLLGLRSLTLSSSFPEWFWRAGLDFGFGLQNLNLEYAVDQSIFDELRSNTISGSYQFPLGPAGDYYLELRLGNQDTDDLPSLWFGILSFYWFF